MHPVSTLLFLFGYALAVPTLSKLRQIIAEEHRLAFAGHQIGMTVASLGWMLRGRWVIVAIHVVWMIIARVWFGLDRGGSGERPRRRGATNG